MSTRGCAGKKSVRIYSRMAVLCSIIGINAAEIPSALAASAVTLGTVEVKANGGGGGGGGGHGANGGGGDGGGGRGGREPEPTTLETVNVFAVRPSYLNFTGHWLFSMGRSDKSQETAEGGPCDKENPTGGNPVVLATGNKVEPEFDFVSKGEMPLFLARVYVNQWTARGLFGRHWISNFDYSLTPQQTTNGTVLWVQYPDGRRIRFLRDSGSGRWKENKPQAVAWVEKMTDGSYTLHNEGRGIERYNAAGYVIELRNEQGVSWTFAYSSSKYLQSVTHSSGRKISFTWSGNEVTKVVAPNGAEFIYSYTPNVFGAGRGRLAGITVPGTPATKITYHYEDTRFPGALTGKSFGGARFSIFAYDDRGRVARSEHAGGVERYSFSYTTEMEEQVEMPPAPPPPGGFTDDEDRVICEYRPGTGSTCNRPRALPGDSVFISDATATATTSTKPRAVVFRVDETNPLGMKTIYRFKDAKLVSVEGTATARCPARYKEQSYDANGYLDIASDFRDGVSNFDYDAQGHLLKKVEAVGKAESRTTTYDWDMANNRLLREIVVGIRETTLSYDEKGRPGSITVKNLSGNGLVNQVQKTVYTYTEHSNGLVATIKEDGPIPGEADAITMAYSTTGDLIKVVNSLGHVVTYSGHNGLGLPGSITGSNGEKRSFVYDADGRVLEEKTYRNGSAQTTSYTYDGFGRLATITLPDGVKRYYQYDVAGRLLTESESEAGGTFAQRVYAYNAMSKPTSITVQRISVQPLQGTQP